MKNLQSVEGTAVNDLNGSGGGIFGDYLTHCFLFGIYQENRRIPPTIPLTKSIRQAVRFRRCFSAEDEIRIVLDGLRGENGIAELCCKEGITQSLCYG